MPPPPHRKILIIGAGPGGICMGVALKAAGLDDFVILERGARAGGVWAANIYPGCGCDAKSHVYTFSFELNPAWSRTWAKQPEILAYFEKCTRKYGLAPHIRFNTEAISAHWDDEGAQWRVTTAAGETVTADIVVSAMGMFNQPKWPDIPGLDRFKGLLQHSARWRPENDLRGKDVAIIGTGASTIQLAPAIAPDVGRLFVFQRTPPWVLVKKDEITTPEQIARFRDDPAALRGHYDEIFNEFERFIDFTNAAFVAKMQKIGLENLNNVEDPELRSRLTPAHPFGFSRPLFSGDYYQMYNRDNVELVTDAISAVTENAIVAANGKERRVDAIICATGFETTKFLSAIEVTGRGGRSIKEAWKNGAQAYQGVTTSGFPNLFMIYGPNTNQGVILFMLECQATYIARQITRMNEEGLRWVDVKPEAMEAYNRDLQAALARVAPWQTDANGYYRAESGRIVTQYPHLMTYYRAQMMAPDAAAYETLSLSSHGL